MSMRCCPVSGGLAEVWAVGEVEEDGPCGAHEFRDAGCALVGVQGEVGCEGVGQGVVVVPGRFPEGLRRLGRVRASVPPGLGGTDSLVTTLDAVASGWLA